MLSEHLTSVIRKYKRCNPNMCACVRVCVRAVGPWSRGSFAVRPPTDGVGQAGVLGQVGHQCHGVPLQVDLGRPQQWRDDSQTVELLHHRLADDVGNLTSGRWKNISHTSSTQRPRLSDHYSTPVLLVHVVLLYEYIRLNIIVHSGIELPEWCST